MEPAGSRPPPGRVNPGTAVGAPANRHLKVLVADDERNTVWLIRKTLERQGIDVVTAYDGKECLVKLYEEMPDVVVLDVMMPSMDGFEVLRHIRSDPLVANVIVVMLTAKAQDRDFFEGYDQGADMYLTKPFNPSELLMIIRP